MKEVMTVEAARAEIEAQVAKKKMLPSKREKLNPIIDHLAEAMQFGLIVLDNGAFKQTLLNPVCDKDGNIALSTIEYKAVLSVEEINRKIKTLPATAGFRQQLNVYSTALTSLPEAMLDKLESTDRETVDAISTLFL